MTNVLIVGSKGNMGRRYKVILDYLKIPNFGIDLHDLAVTEKPSHIIIATPTNSHIDDIDKYLKYSVPILCEKPLSKNLIEVELLIRDFGRDEKIAMVNQYEYLLDKKSNGDTSYNYWKTGSDGLYWDTINIIGLADGNVEIKNDSPYWRCMINGLELDISDMDYAYVEMLYQWIKSPKGNLPYALRAHEKVQRMIDEHS